MITIDASSLTERFDYTTFFEDYYADLPTGSSTYHGGEPDIAFGGEYYVSGSQVSFTFGENSDAMILLVGEDIAYDFIHHGAAYGHGISGQIDTVIFGQADEDTTTEDGTENGEVTGLDGLVISGLDISAAPGSGNVPENPVYQLYDAARTGLNGEEGEDPIGDLYAIFSADDQEFIGSAQNDKFFAGDGDDHLSGGAGRDHLAGHKGHDTLDGGAGRDFLRGGAQGDVLNGGDGNDKLFGGNGVDALYGDAGDDIIIGGRDVDRLWGGEGEDTFLYRNASDSKVDSFDRIKDFETGVDKIDLSALGDNLTFVEEFSGAAGEVRIDDQGRQSAIEADLDGDGAADFMVLVRFGDVVDSDLILV